MKHSSITLKLNTKAVNEAKAPLYDFSREEGHPVYVESAIRLRQFKGFMKKFYHPAIDFMIEKINNAPSAFTQEVKDHKINTASLFELDGFLLNQILIHITSDGTATDMWSFQK